MVETVRTTWELMVTQDISVTDNEGAQYTGGVASAGGASREWEEHQVPRLRPRKSLQCLTVAV